METESYVYKKEVDWSLFKDGFAIPLKYQVVFKKVANRFLQRGERKNIRLYLNGKMYEARLQNNNISDKFGNHSDIVQVRYGENSDIAIALRACFSHSYSYIKAIKEQQEPGSKKKISVPDEYKEYLVVYTTEDDDSYVLETITSEEIEALKASVIGKNEQKIETEMDYEEKDEGAGIKISQRLVKIRKLNRSIGENLKLLYGYRCQICGRIIGEEFGSHIAEAHHIDFFVHSLNNDASNQMVVCPNHHRIIHDANPVYDRNRHLYVYPNGIEQKLVLNKHL